MKTTWAKSLLFSLALTGMTACEEDDISQITDIEVDIPSKDITYPSLDKYLTTTDTDGFSIRARFDNGGDVTSNMSCTVHWRAYTSKPSSRPSTSAMNRHESMRIYDKTTKSTTFDKSHAGYSGGTYIYYYMECENSKYTCTTPVTYTIVKR